MKRSLGFSIAEVLVGMIVLIMGVLIVTQLSKQSQDENKSLQNSSVVSEFKNELRTVLSTRSLCYHAFKDVVMGNDVLPTYLNTSYFPIKKIVMGDQVIAEEGATRPDNITITGLAFDLLQPSITSADPDGVHTRYLTKLKISSQISASADAATKQLPLMMYLVELLVDDSNKVTGCVGKDVKLESASATRSAFALQNRLCSHDSNADLPNYYYRKPESFSPPEICDDSNDDGICNNSSALSCGGISCTAKDHPRYNSDEWWQYFPKRTMSPTNGAPPPPALPLNVNSEGRCWVTINKVPSHVTDADDVFVIPDSAYAGPNLAIGCRSSAGWFIGSCYRSDKSKGNGDSDIFVTTHNGNDYCTTNDHKDPHITNAWDVNRVTLGVVCLRMAP